MNALNEASVRVQSVAALEDAVSDSLGRDVDLTEEMVEFVTRTPEGVEGTTFRVDGSERGVVYVDTALTEDIESEGYAREVIRRIQEMRKDLDLDLEAEVRVELDVRDERVADLVRRHEALIAGEVRAAEFGEVTDGHRKEWDVEGVTMEIAVEPLAAPSASD
jgi:isoleucyl-tRNA synthetase